MLIMHFIYVQSDIVYVIVTEGSHQLAPVSTS